MSPGEPDSRARDLEKALDELPIDRDAWLAQAREVLDRAYSPYSNVRVGAVLVDRQGRTFAGCNVENASYGLTVCAERNAVGRALAEGAGELLAIVIATDRERPLMPCGACRQVLAELAPELVLLAVGAGGTRTLHRWSDLLPEAFSPGDLDG